ncbi:hypothetical protein A2cp1_1117 [Anaeromyxobacter dehalogenans 2CP-1]|uniref:Uncharacterized protein n=1 Tax=Anaeromyxobacter dehalogenans (strain ATCC BAA-258 / DSM 21875 / 2CP-1) TaxID=455488 RepID=B8JFA5_ANAD2|nr:hypothetical protein [Anaeromyxobacter dehalogenans]ACL64462.1 hypothetical protein A2cp1_1117 [Anaeromyxobacter dehalogenans 2CP-1]
MARTDEAVAQILARKPFAVLGYSAEDAVWCPACLRTAAGLSPGRTDTCGQPVFPLYARDAAVREEICEKCERSLYELLAARHGAAKPKAVTAQLRVHGKRCTLEFERLPPAEVRTALKSTGWRWDPRLRVWWSGEAVPRVPTGVVLPGAEKPHTAAAKPPIVRRRS